MTVWKEKGNAGLFKTEFFSATCISQNGNMFGDIQECVGFSCLVYKAMYLQISPGVDQPDGLVYIL